MEIIPQPEWEILLNELLKHRGTSIIIGSTDSGKSTLTRYLLNGLISEGMKVCLVDSDVGQSSLGLPGTISIKVFSVEEDLENFTFKKMSFAGTLNPAKRTRFIIESTKRLSDFCRERSDITLVDTSGLVFGEAGKALKIGKIKALKPEHVIAMQRSDELEHILNLIEGCRIHRITVSGSARIRSVAARIQYRKKKYDSYFNKAGSADFLLYANEAQFLYNNRPFRPGESLFKEGALIGLNHDEETIALGILEEITETSVTFRSPIKSIKKINRVVFGDITA